MNATDSEVLRKAQEQIARRQAQQGIAPRERAGDVILREVERDVARRAASRAPGARAALPKPQTTVAPAVAIDQNADDALSSPIPEGDYVVSYKRTEVGHAFGREFWIAHFAVVGGEHAGRILPRFYNPPPGAYLARSSNLWRDFVALTGKRPPSEGFYSEWLLRGCLIVARVVTVKDRPGTKGKRIPMAECEWYSRIDALLRIESGRPPALTGSREGMKMPKSKKKRPSS